MTENLEKIENSVIFKAPAKLIITGEYSAIFGRKALLTSINLFTECEISRNKNFQANSNLIPSNKLKENFFRIFNILGHKIPNIKIKIHSNIPLNRGLGSSAAFLNSFFLNYIEFLTKGKQNTELLDEKKSLYEEIKNLESIFHGKSSGIDAFTSLFGGVVSFENFKAKRLDFDLEEDFSKNFTIIDTGKKNDTKKTIQNVMQNFKENDKIWRDFNLISNKIEEKLKNKEFFGDLIYENHKLLKKINVVPEKVCNLIEELKNNNCYAKISGSGGNFEEKNGGICLVFGNKQQIEEIANRFNYEILKDIKSENRGTEKKEIQISTPGKVVLFGEHAVLHNKKAISIAINQRLYLVISKNWANSIEINTNNEKEIIDLESKFKKKDKYYLIWKILKILKLNIGIKIKIKSEIKTGLGSSGALISGLTASLYEYQNIKIQKKKLLKKCIEISNKVKHTKYSSGVDLATSIFGNIIEYQKNKTPKIIYSKDFSVFTIFTGMKTSVDKAISKIKKTVNEKNEFKVYNKINSTVKKAIIAFQKEDFSQLENLTKENQDYLEKLNLMNKHTKLTAKKIEEFGVQDYKISGSGLGDYLITFNKKAKDKLLELKNEQGIIYYD